MRAVLAGFLGVSFLVGVQGFEQTAIPHYEAFLNSLPSQTKPQSAAAADRLLELRAKYQ